MPWIDVKPNAGSSAGYHNIISSFQSHANASADRQSSSSISSAYDAASKRDGWADHVGSSAEAATGELDGLPTVGPSAKDSTIDTTGMWKYYDPNGFAGALNSASGDVSETDLQLPYDFMDTSLASIFGMDAATHYQEALSNTAYQRQIRDLKAAGLNPVLGMSGNGAAVFRGTEGPIGASSGSGGASFGSIGSGKSNAAQTAYKLGNVLPGLANAAASLGVIVATKGRGSYFAPAVGYAAQNTVTSILNAIRNFS